VKGRSRGGAAWFDTIHDMLTTAPRQHASMLRQDVGYTLRTLRRTPGFTAAALLTLAIGISASASIFTVINAFLFRPLPVERPEELVSIATLGDQHIEMPHGVSFRDLQDYGALTDVFAGLLGYQPHGRGSRPGTPAIGSSWKQSPRTALRCLEYAPRSAACWRRPTSGSQWSCCLTNTGAHGLAATRPSSDRAPA
jgi:hypothetical protein